MGTERMAPGKSNATHDPSSSRANNEHSAPGKTTRVETEGSRYPSSWSDSVSKPESNRFPSSWGRGVADLTGGKVGGGKTAGADPAIAENADQAKQGMGGDENYPPGYREKLERIRGDRVNQAYTNAMTALVKLWTETLVTSVNEVPWWASMILGLVLTQLGNVISGAIGALKNATNIPNAIKLAVPEFEGSVAEAIAAANDSGVRWAKKEAWLEATKDFRALAAKNIEDITKKSVDSFLRPVSAADIAGAFNSDSSAATDKSNAISYIDLITDQLGQAFEAVRERAPTGMTIAQLTADTKAWAQVHHSVSHYYAVFHEMVTKFIASNAAKIGRAGTWDQDTGKHVEREVRIAKLIYGPGIVKYVYMDRVFDDWYQSRSPIVDNVVSVKRSDAYDAQQNALSLSEASTWTIEGQETQHRETPLRDDKILNMVEPEFENIAVQRSKAKWATGPAVFQLDYQHMIAPGVPAVVKVAGE